MTILSAKDNLLGGANGETITVSVNFGGVVDRVTFERNGSTGQIIKGIPFTFRLTADCLLTLEFHFFGGASGAYTVTISGQGGQTFSKPYQTGFGIPVDAATYDFRVV